MAEAKHDEGDPVLRKLFEEFDGRLISPGGAASLLGVSRSTISTLIKRGRIRAFRSPENAGGRLIHSGPKWVYIPQDDLRAYAEEVGRPYPVGTGTGPVR